MRFIQVAHAITPGDAASNQLLAMDKAFQKLGYCSEIYSNKFDQSLADRVRHFSSLVPDPQSILIYHMTTGTSFTNAILRYPFPVALYYHNITPAHFFFGNAWGSFIKCLKGRKQLKKLKEKTFFSWSASKYSREELVDMGFQNTAVLPIMLDYEEYRSTPVQQHLLDQYQDGAVTLLMVGRVTPHKKQDEAIQAVSYYKQNFSDQIRLIIVGNHKENYGAKLRKLACKLGVSENVVFTGKVSFVDLCTYYRLSDILLCLSEHEGFCVPLVESMLFDKPILAYGAAAVPETIGGAGVLLADKSQATIAQAIHDLISSPEALESMAAKRKSQLAAFSSDRLLDQMEQDIQQLVRIFKEQGR